MTLAFMRLPGSIVVAIAAACGACRAPAGQYTLSYYLGKGDTWDSDLEMKRPGGTDLTFHDVEFEDASFEGPIFYGYRVTYWPESAPEWGFALDLTHTKAIADTDDVVHITGTDAGAPVDVHAPINTYLQGFQVSHGNNIITLNVLRRWIPTEPKSGSFSSRLEPYVGAGAGIAVPHVEADVGTDHTFEYQEAGPAIQGFGGVNLNLGDHFALFSELKLSWSSLDLDLEGGGSIETDLWTRQLILGLSYRL